MKKTSLQFKDILQLLEYLEYTDMHHCIVDYEKITITCHLSEADIELAIHGYDAEIIEEE